MMACECNYAYHDGADVALTQDTELGECHVGADDVRDSFAQRRYHAAALGLDRLDELNHGAIVRERACEPTCERGKNSIQPRWFQRSSETHTMDFASGSMPRGLIQNLAAANMVEQRATAGERATIPDSPMKARQPRRNLGVSRVIVKYR